MNGPPYLIMRWGAWSRLNKLTCHRERGEGKEKLLTKAKSEREEAEITTNFDAVELKGRYKTAAWHWLTLPRRRRGRQSGHQTTDSPYLPTVTLIGYRCSAVQPIYTKTFPGYLRLSSCVCVCASFRCLLHAILPPLPYSNRHTPPTAAPFLSSGSELVHSLGKGEKKKKTFPPRWHSSS